jgi:hypothetical protein
MVLRNCDSYATGGRMPQLLRNGCSVGLEFPTMGGESPQKIWVVGCEASIFFTLTMNPVDEYWDERETGSDMPHTWMENWSS